MQDDCARRRVSPCKLSNSSLPEVYSCVGGIRAPRPCMAAGAAVSFLPSAMNVDALSEGCRGT